MIKKLIIASGCFLLTLAIAEVLVRIAFPEWAPRSSQLVEFWQYDERYGWSHVPGSTGRFTSYGFDVAVAINEQGFRGPIVSPEREPGKTRILVVGDSLVWGFGTEEQDTFVAQMAQACSNLEVVNYGVSGYATDQELLLFKEQGKALKPDIVILVVASNDFSDNIRSTVNVYYNKPMYRIEGDRLVLTNRPVAPPAFTVRAVSTIARHSYLLTQLGRILQGLIIAGEAPAPLTNRPAENSPRPFPRNKAEHVTARLIGAFIEEVRQSGAAPAIVFNDPRGQLLSDYLNLNSLPVVQLGDIKRHPDPERYHLKGDFHWNAEGHSLVAQRILAALREKGKLADCPLDSAIPASRD